MQQPGSPVTLPPIRLLLDEITHQQAPPRFHPHPYLFVPIHAPVRSAPARPISNVSIASAAAGPSRHIPPHAPSYYPSTQLPSHIQPPYRGASQGPSFHHHPNESMRPSSHRSQNTLFPSPGRSFNSLETTSPPALSYSLSPVSLNSLPETPALEHASTSYLFHAEFRAGEDNLAQRVEGLELDQGMRPPKIPPRPVLRSTFEADVPMAFDHLVYSHPPPPPSTSPSFSIAGSPKTDVHGLPFPLVPAMPSLPVPQPSSSAVQSETKPKRKRKPRTTTGPRAPRVPGKLTKNGTDYSRYRPEQLRLPPGRKVITRKSWTQKEEATGWKAIRWYESQTPGFIMTESTEPEQWLAFPEMFMYIKDVLEPDTWARAYDGFLTWASKRARPTTRNPAPRARQRASRTARAANP